MVVILTIIKTINKKIIKAIMIIVTLATIQKNNILMILIIAIFLKKIWLTKFFQMMFLKIMFEHVQVSFFYFFRDFISQCQTNER